MFTVTKCDYDNKGRAKYTYNNSYKDITNIVQNEITNIELNSHISERNMSFYNGAKKKNIEKGKLTNTLDFICINL